MSSIAVRQGEPRIAAQLMGASQAAYEDLGADREWWAGRRDAESLEMIRSAIGPAVTDEELAAGRALGFEAAVALALGHTAEPAS